MPLHVDVKINDEIIERFHIGRFGDTGTAVGNTYDYRVVVGEKELLPPEEYTFAKREDFPKEPGFLDWEETPIRFNHRYGDGALVCVLKALAAAIPEHAEAVDREFQMAELTRENDELRRQLAEAQAKLDAPPF